MSPVITVNSSRIMMDGRTAVLISALKVERLCGALDPAGGKLVLVSISNVLQARLRPVTMRSMSLMPMKGATIPPTP